MYFPNELINEIFSYSSSPTSPLIKELIKNYHKEEYFINSDGWSFSFQEFYFLTVMNNKTSVYYEECYRWEPVQDEMEYYRINNINKLAHGYGLFS